MHQVAAVGLHGVSHIRSVARAGDLNVNTLPAGDYACARRLLQVIFTRKFDRGPGGERVRRVANRDVLSHARRSDA